MNLYVVLHDDEYVLIAGEDMLEALEFCYDNISCNVKSVQFLRKLNASERVFNMSK